VVILVLAGCGRIGFGTSGDDEPPAGTERAIDGTPRVGCDVLHPGALLCEGFESPSAAWDYTIINQGSAARSTARALQGNASLEAKTFDVTQYKDARWGLNGVLPEITSGDFWIREWYWLETSTTVTDQLSILVTGNFADPYPSTNVVLMPGLLNVNVNGDSHIIAYNFPRGRWVCVELHLDVGAAGRVELAIDGASVLNVPNVDTRVAGGYTNIDAGVHYATPDQTPAHMFVDEIVAKTSAIGCD
jgi:hypothetical protein